MNISQTRSKFNGLCSTRRTTWKGLLTYILAVALCGCQVISNTKAIPTVSTAPTIPDPTPTPAHTSTPLPTPTLAGFNGDRAYADVAYQVNLGPRTPGSPGHAAILRWMQAELETAGWQVEIQESTWKDQPVRNLVARRGNGKPWIILGAHYDTRMVADHDPDPARRNDPVPGANDGASGVAVLLELARVLPADLDQEIWLAFFDLEDQGNISGWDWIIGSTILADSLVDLPYKPDAVVIVDMVGDADLNLPMERNSTQELVKEIWDTAARLGYSDVFIQEPGYAMLDDHTPFLRHQIPAVDIIDFDYPYWHTVADTPDKVSAASLFIVGETLFEWLTNRP